MTTKARLNINLDSELKQKTADTLDELGLDFTTAITIYFKQIVNQQKIPFEIAVKRYYTTDEVLGADWREGLEDVEDEWE